MFLFEGAHNAEVLLNEANGERSRALVTIPSGAGKVAPGTLLTTAGAVATDWTTVALVNLNWVDATSAAKQAAVISCDAEVHGEFLAWGAATDTNKKAAESALAERGIIVRWTTPPSGDVANGGGVGVVEEGDATGA